MVHWLALLIGGYVAGEAYKKLVHEKTKKKWENYIKSHHGE